MRLFHYSQQGYQGKKATIEIRWAVVSGEPLIDMRIDAVIFTDPDQAELYADAILEAAARMRGNTDIPNNRA